MLTPMLVQYLVALCCACRNPDAVDVTLGDMVLDAAARKTRDVDITITIREIDGALRAFKAYEVKREGEPLDVASVEQLCIKLKDMPTVTYPAIVSASGFTDGAIAKANAHGVELYVLKPWIKPLADGFPALKDLGSPQQEFSRSHSILLHWKDWTLGFHGLGTSQSLQLAGSSPVFSADGRLHEQYANLDQFAHSLLQRSTDILATAEPAKTLAIPFRAQVAAENQDVSESPSSPHTHEMQVVADQVFVNHNNALILTDSVTISGHLYWRAHMRVPEHFVLERVPTGEAFAGAVVIDWGSPGGGMSALIFSPDSRDIKVHRQIRLLDKHRHALRQMKIDSVPKPMAGTLMITYETR